MDKERLRMPLVVLWGVLAMFGTKLLKWYLKMNGLFDQQAAHIYNQCKLVLLVAILSSLIYEYIRYTDYAFDKDDDDY